MVSEEVLESLPPSVQEVIAAGGQTGGVIVSGGGATTSIEQVLAQQAQATAIPVTGTIQERVKAARPLSAAEIFSPAARERFGITTPREGGLRVEARGRQIVRTPLGEIKAPVSATVRPRFAAELQRQAAREAERRAREDRPIFIGGAVTRTGTGDQLVAVPGRDIPTARRATFSTLTSPEKSAFFTQVIKRKTDVRGVEDVESILRRRSIELADRVGTLGIRDEVLPQPTEKEAFITGLKEVPKFILSATKGVGKFFFAPTFGAPPPKIEIGQSRILQVKGNILTDPDIRAAGLILGITVLPPLAKRIVFAGAVGERVQRITGAIGAERAREVGGLVSIVGTVGLIKAAGKTIPAFATRKVGGVREILIRTKGEPAKFEFIRPSGKGLRVGFLPPSFITPPTGAIIPTGTALTTTTGVGALLTAAAFRGLGAEQIAIPTTTGRVNIQSLGIQRRGRALVLVSNVDGRIVLGTPDVSTELQKLVIGQEIKPGSAIETKIIRTALQKAQGVTVQGREAIIPAQQIIRATRTVQSRFITGLPVQTERLPPIGTEAILNVAREEGAVVFGSFSRAAQLLGTAPVPKDIDVRIVDGTPADIKRIQQKAIDRLNALGFEAKAKGLDGVAVNIDGQFVKVAEFKTEGFGEGEQVPAQVLGFEKFGKPIIVDKTTVSPLAEELRGTLQGFIRVRRTEEGLTISPPERRAKDIPAAFLAAETLAASRFFPSFTLRPAIAKLRSLFPEAAELEPRIILADFGKGLPIVSPTGIVSPRTAFSPLAARPSPGVSPAISPTQISPTPSPTPSPRPSPAPSPAPSPFSPAASPFASPTGSPLGAISPRTAFSAVSPSPAAVSSPLLSPFGSPSPSSSSPASPISPVSPKSPISPSPRPSEISPRPPPPPPRRKFTPKQRKRLRAVLAKLEQGYIAKVKNPIRKGVKRAKQRRGFTTINNKPQTKAQATNKLLRTLDNFSNQTGKLVKKGRVRPSNVRVDRFLLSKFRQPRGMSNTYIEKRAFAIDSFQEKREIPFKAAKLRRAGAFKLKKSKDNTLFA